jgi:hypothetical protein
MIHWTPISQLPDELRDGRPILLLMTVTKLCVVASWSSWHDSWMDRRGRIHGGDEFATHYSEINSPEAWQ